LFSLGLGSTASRMTVPMTARRSRGGNIEHMVPNVVMDEEVVCSSVIEDTKLDISSSLANVKYKQVHNYLIFSSLYSSIYCKSQP
jgi:hypothetical protein